MKRCAGCGQLRDDDQFRARVYNSGRVGLGPRCLVCQPRRPPKVVAPTNPNDPDNDAAWVGKCQWQRWGSRPCGKVATYTCPAGGRWQACYLHRLQGDIPIEGPDLACEPDSP